MKNGQHLIEGEETESQKLKKLKMKLKSAGMLGCSDKKVEKNKSSDDRFNLNFSIIFSVLLEEAQRNSSKISTSPPERIADISLCPNSLELAQLEVSEGTLDSPKQGLLDILEELQTADSNVPSERLAICGTSRIQVNFALTQCLRSIIGF